MALGTNLKKKIFMIYIAFILKLTKMTISLLQKLLITLLNMKKITISIKYSNFSTFFHSTL